MSKLGIDFAPSHIASRTVTIGRAAYIELLTTKYASVKDAEFKKQRKIDEWLRSPQRLVDAKNSAALKIFKEVYDEIDSFLMERRVYPSLSIIDKIKWKYFLNLHEKRFVASRYGYKSVRTVDILPSSESDDDVYTYYKEFSNTNLSFEEFSTNALNDYAEKMNVDIPTAVEILNRQKYNYHVYYNVHTQDRKSLDTLLASINKVSDAYFSISEAEFLELTR